MKTTERQASKRLFKKLSALRATLSNEERKILDEIIVSEVAAHKMTDRATSKAANRATSKATEVAAHKMTDRATSKAADRATSKATEVAAHKMTDRATSKAADRATSKTTFRIVFDPNSEEYKVSE